MCTTVVSTNDYYYYLQERSSSCSSQKYQRVHFDSFFLGGEQKLFQSIRRYSVTKSGKSLVKFHWQQWFESLFSIWQNIEPILAYVFAIEANFDPSKFQNLEFLVKHLVTLFVTI